MKIKTNKNESYITYRKEDGEWFVITENKNGKRIEISFPTKKEALFGWKDHIYEELLNPKFEKQVFNVFVKNMDGKWNYQIILNHDNIEKKSTFSKEMISKGEKNNLNDTQDNSLLMTLNKNKSNVEERNMSNIQNNEQQNVQDIEKMNNNYGQQNSEIIINNQEDKIIDENKNKNGYMKVRKIWIYLYILLIILSLVLSSIAFAFWIK